MTHDRQHDEAKGLWQFQGEVAFDHAPGLQANDVFTFTYDGGYVTLRLVTLRMGQWKSDDDFYTLQTRWEGDTLHYRPPFGEWTVLASFEDGRFVNIGNGKKRLFGKITAEQVVAWNAAILAPARPPHDYSISPNGSLKEQP